MSASRLDTVRRVAVLRTTAARAAVGAANVRCDIAQRHLEARTADLAGSSLAAGSAGQVQAGLAGSSRLAEAVGDAGREAALRAEERHAAVSGWSAATRRARLLDDVCARQRAEREAHAELRTQHLLDDLAAGSTRTGART